jgi:hypothetical protein
MAALYHYSGASAPSSYKHHPGSNPFALSTGTSVGARR